MAEKLIFIVVPYIHKANKYPPGEESIVRDLGDWQIVIMTQEEEKGEFPYAFAKSTHDQIQFWTLETIEGFLTKESKQEYEVILVTEINLNYSDRRRDEIKAQLPDYEGIGLQVIDGVSLCMRAFANRSILKTMVYFSSELNAVDPNQFLEKCARSDVHKVLSEARKLYGLHQPENFRKIWDQLMQEWITWQSFCELHPLEALLNFLGGEGGLSNAEIHDPGNHPLILEQIQKLLRLRGEEFEQLSREFPRLKGSLIDAIKYLGTWKENRQRHHCGMTLLGMCLMAWMAYRFRIRKASFETDKVFVKALTYQYGTDTTLKHMVVHYNFLPEQEIGSYRQTLRCFFDLFCLLFIDESSMTNGKDQTTVREVYLDGECLQIKLGIKGGGLFRYANEKLWAIMNGRLPMEGHNVSRQLLKCWLAFHYCNDHELGLNKKQCHSWSNLANFSIHPDGEEGIFLVFNTSMQAVFRLQTR